MRLYALLCLVAFATLFLTTFAEEASLADAGFTEADLTEADFAESEPELDARGLAGHNAYSVLSSALSKQRPHPKTSHPKTSHLGTSQPKPTSTKKPHSTQKSPDNTSKPKPKTTKKTFWHSDGGGVRTHIQHSQTCYNGCFKV